MPKKAVLFDLDGTLLNSLPDISRCMNTVLEKHGLPLRTDMDAESLARGALSDKKRAGGTLNLVVPCAFGESRLNPVPVAELTDWARAGLKP